MKDESFCVKCKIKTLTTDIYKSYTIKNAPVLKGYCSECRCKKCVFIKKEKKK